MIPRWLSKISLVGILLCVIATAAALMFGYFHPIQNSSFNFIWGVFYAILFLGLFLLLWMRRTNIIYRTIFLLLTGIFIVVITYSDNGPALFAIVWIILLSGAIGGSILNALGKRSNQFPDVTSFEKFLIRAGLGLISLTIFTLILSCAHYASPYLGHFARYSYLLKAVVVLPFLAILSLIYWSTMIGELKQVIGFLKGFWQDKIPEKDSIYWGLIFICLLGTVFWALSPSIRFDSLSYHLGVPSIYDHSGGMVQIPEAYASNWAHYAEILYAFSLTIAGQPLPNLLNFVVSLMTGGITFSLGRRLFSAKVGMIAAVLFFSLPMISFESGTAYIDIFLTFFITAAVYCAVISIHENNRAWLVISGIFAGFSLGIKANAILLLAPFFIFTLAYSLWKHKFSPDFFLSTVYFFLPVLILWSPWLLRDWLWTGTPVFPLYNSLFPAPANGIPDIFDFNLKKGLTLVDLITLPLQLVFTSSKFYREGPAGTLGVLPLLFFPWYYSWSPFYNRTTKLLSSILFGLIIAGSLLVFSFSAVARYLMPFFPLSCILAGANIEILWKSLPMEGFSKLSRPALVMAIIYLFSTRLGYINRSWQIPEVFPYKVALGLETQQDYLSRTLPVYDALQYLNSEGDGNHKVLSINNETRLYTTSKIFGVSLSTDAMRLLQIAQPEQLASSMAGENFDYILASSPSTNSDQNQSLLVLQPAFLQKYTRLEFARNNVYVYHFYPNGVPPLVDLTGINLLKNPGFEQSGSANSPASWEISGRPFMDSSGRQAHSGKSALETTSSDIAYQTTDAKANQLYTLGEWLRADPGSPPEARMEIMWLDRNHQQSRVSIDVVPVGNNWEWHQMSVTAPEGAVYARVYVSAHDNSKVWADDICLAQGDRCDIQK